ncbi:MAG: hypothetical protein K8R40_02400 [Anaerolineaceae bacterium]|nr:hypothetical protein [Anaerolineaceae bacterium]
MNSQNLSNIEETPLLLHSQRYGWWMVQDRSGRICSGEHDDPQEAAKEYWRLERNLPHPSLEGGR